MAPAPSGSLRKYLCLWGHILSGANQRAPSSSSVWFFQISLHCSHWQWWLHSSGVCPRWGLPGSLSGSGLSGGGPQSAYFVAVVGWKKSRIIIFDFNWRGACLVNLFHIIFFWPLRIVWSHTIFPSTSLISFILKSTSASFMNTSKKFSLVLSYLSFIFCGGSRWEFFFLFFFIFKFRILKLLILF